MRVMATFNHQPMECARLIQLYHFLFLHLSKVWGKLYHGTVGRVQNKNTTLCFDLLFWHFLLFFIIKFVFIIFISFFDEVSNFRKRVLTNQKQELVAQNFQWNCMYEKCLFTALRTVNNVNIS